MYAILVHYQKPLEEVEKFLVEHRNFLEVWYQKGLLIASGPQNPRTGGLILSRQIDRKALEDIFKADPFAREKIARYEFIEFSPVKYAKGFEPFLNTAG